MDKCGQISPIPQTMTLKSADHSDYMLKRLEKFYMNEEFCDVTLIAASDNTQVKAHRGALAVASEFFFKMFSTEFKQSKSNEIELKDINGVVLRLIVNFVYTASIELSSELVEQIAKAAHLYEINSLVDTCCDFIGELLTLDNCIYFYAMAEQYGWKKLQQKAIGVIAKSLSSVASDPEFLQLNQDQLCKLIGSDDLDVQSEEEVFHSIVQWIKHDELSRTGSMLALLKNVRFSNLSSKFISENRRLVCKNDECNDLLWNWMEWLWSPEKRSQIIGLNTKSRKSGHIQTIIAFNNDLRIMYTFDSYTNIWWEKELQIRESEIQDFALASANDKLYITGGRRRLEDLCTVICIDSKTYEVTYLPRMKRKRCMHSSVCLNGALYVCGGFALNCIEKYDFSNQTWQDIPCVPLPYQLQTAVLNNDIYIIGAQSMYSYNTTTSLMSKKPFKRHNEGNFVLCAVNGYLYAVGYPEHTIIERYDPTAQSWSDIKPLPGTNDTIKCISYNNRLCVLGCNDKNIIISADEYYPELNEWKTSAIVRLNEPIRFISVVEHE